MDLVGPLPVAKGEVKFVVVTVDYFMKWIEAKAVMTITATSITKFLWKSVVCRFNILQSIISDNGRQFDSSHYREWCIGLGIKFKYSSPGHPQSNGQVEATNKTLLSILKKRLEDRNGKWVEELPGVLWAYRTIVKTATGETPFALTYGSGGRNANLSGPALQPKPQQ